MLVGHLAVGLAAKRAAPKTSLGTLIFSAMLPDCLAAAFLIIGLEHWRLVPGERGIHSVDLYDIALSHSLATGILWGALFAGVFFAMRRYRQGAWAIFLVCISHWFLDVASHLPDMPLAPGLQTRLGLGLWTSLPATLAVEGSMWVAALFLYARATRSRSRVLAFAFWFVVVLLTRELLCAARACRWIRSNRCPREPHLFRARHRLGILDEPRKNPASSAV